MSNEMANPFDDFPEVSTVAPAQNAATGTQANTTAISPDCPFCGRPRGETYPPYPRKPSYKPEPAGHCPTCWHRHGRVISLTAQSPKTELEHSEHGTTKKALCSTVFTVFAYIAINVSNLTNVRPNEHRNTAGTQQEHGLKIFVNHLYHSLYYFEHSEHSNNREKGEIGIKTQNIYTGTPF
jgi:hypothetical protein